MEILRAPLPDLQIAFYSRLEELRNRLLLDALLSVVANTDILEIDKQLRSFVSKKALQKMASWGLRGEIAFPVPCVLIASPRLLGYYRLLLGFSQKEFYGKGYGLNIFKSMEERSLINPRQKSSLEDLCKCLCGSSQYFIDGVGKLSPSAVHELTLLTLGPLLRGSVLNLFGARATDQIFQLIKTIVAPAIIKSDSRSLELKNAAGRKVTIAFANDPDICIREELASGQWRNLVAIEIKGGKDVSNVHNRLGEAEKSHQKARKDGFVECWTMLGVADIDMNTARNESPSTDRFYGIGTIIKVGSYEFHDFRDHLRARVGVSD